MKKLEIHIFPGKTESAKILRMSLPKALALAVLAVAGLFGFILFSPTQIVNNVSDGSALNVYRQNAAVKKEIKKIRESVDESILMAEDVRQVRDSTIYVGGLGFTLDESIPDEIAPGVPRKSLTAMERSFRRLIDHLEQDSSLAARIPILHPFKNNHIVKNRFEIIYDPFTEQDLPHRGIDYVAAPGDTVYATGGGVVSEIRSHRGFGLAMKIEHTPLVKTFYAHLGQPLVKVGARVRRGEPVALIGESGRETGVGLHYEIRLNGVPVDPDNYFITK